METNLNHLRIGFSAFTLIFRRSDGHGIFKKSESYLSELSGEFL